MQTKTIVEDKYLKKIIKILDNHLNSLERVLNQKKTEIVRDSVIKRFEYSFESCWKTSKQFLFENQGVDIYSPKECFRELGKINLISPKEVEKALIMTNHRNESVHNYSEDFSNELYKKIKNDYINLFKKILKEIK